MVEQWSSKPYAWVRFLLSLFISFLLKVKKTKNQILKKNITKSNYSKNKKFYLTNQKLSNQLKKAHIAKRFYNLRYIKALQNSTNIHLKNTNKFVKYISLYTNNKKFKLDIFLKDKSWLNF